ncbi:MAG: YggT family protein [Calditerrivibrio sp.]|nr:YggT family protein [Calditerrivibrio sp.]MCA1932110.1 YggT family protein [Calditerrivibrio sp.]
MFILIFLLKIYMLALIFRGVFTSQELYFNPFGKLVASLTEPIFANMFKRKSKNYTDRFIPLFLILIVLLQFFINYIGSYSFKSLVLFSTIQDNLNFLALFLIFSIIVGGGKGIATFYSIYFYRIGLPWVKLTRKFIKLPDNRIVLPTIIFVYFLYLLLSVLNNVVFDFVMSQNISFYFIMTKVFKISLYSLSDIFFYLMWLVIIRAFMSWVTPDPRNPIVQIIFSITEPILLPFRRVIPPLGFIDLSAIVAIIVLQILRNLLLMI